MPDSSIERVDGGAGSRESARERETDNERDREREREERETDKQRDGERERESNGQKERYDKGKRHHVCSRVRSQLMGQQTYNHNRKDLYWADLHNTLRVHVPKHAVLTQSHSYVSERREPGDSYLVLRTLPACPPMFGHNSEVLPRLLRRDLDYIATSNVSRTILRAVLWAGRFGEFCSPS